MKTIKLTLIALLTFLFSAGFSQSEEKVAKRKEKIAEILVKRLALTEEEQKNFLPIYEQYVVERKTLRKNFRIVDRKGKKLSESSEADIEKIILNSFEFKQKQLDLKKTYHLKFKQVLPIKKIAKLYRFENRMLNKMKKKRKKRRKK